MFSQRPGDTRNFERELKFAVAPQNAGKLSPSAALRPSGEASSNSFRQIFDGRPGPRKGRACLCVCAHPATI